ncbi:MAG: hypothetical protein A3E78_11820 [Alphaproteobacteria bacterium RIFCSPHIGHO2_12_FULL_63_12]|nr:MAG: hypothetical protein A3E78_11820 [Alphaproteobacteria bacterium RIFCSPHIGHO2_12_FULL_63_12]
MTLTQYEKVNGKSDVQVAEKCGLATSTINRLRRRRMHASLELSLQIERGLDGDVRAEELPLTPETRAALAALRLQMVPAQGTAA